MSPLLQGHRHGWSGWGEDNCPADVGFIRGWRHLELDQTSDLAARLGWAGVLGLGCWASLALSGRAQRRGDPGWVAVMRSRVGSSGVRTLPTACSLTISMCLLILSLLPWLSRQPRSCASCVVSVQEFNWLLCARSPISKERLGAPAHEGQGAASPAGQARCRQVFTHAGGACAWSTRAHLPSGRHSEAFPTQAPASSAAASCKGGTWPFHWREASFLCIPCMSSGIRDHRSGISILS